MDNSVVRAALILALGGLTALAFQNCASPNQVSPSDLNSNKTSPTPIFSTYPSTRFSTTKVNTWEYSGESITITVPPGANKEYRISLRQMANLVSAAGYYVVTLSTSPSSIAGVPQGIGTPFQPATTTWATANSEGYLNLAPGTYTYFVMVTNSVGAMSLANAQSDAGNYCSVIAWPL